MAPEPTEHRMSPPESVSRSHTFSSLSLLSLRWRPARVPYRPEHAGRGFSSWSLPCGGSIVGLFRVTPPSVPDRPLYRPNRLRRRPAILLIPRDPDDAPPDPRRLRDARSAFARCSCCASRIISSRRCFQISRSIVSPLLRSFGCRSGNRRLCYLAPAAGASVASATGLATDAVADVGGLRRVDHPDDVQLDLRRPLVEQPSATTEQHRDLMDLHLVQHPGLERPLRGVPAAHLHVPVAGCGLRLFHR